MREHFWKFKSAKFAPRLRGRTIWKSKSLKHRVFGTFLDLQTVFRVAGAGISTHCKIRGRRRSSWGLQKRWQAWWIWRGSETMHFAWQAQGFRAFRRRCVKAPTQNPWKGCKFHVTEVLLCSDHFAWQLQDFVCLGSTFAWQAQYFWSIHLKIVKTYWNSEVKCTVNMSFLKQVSQKSFVFYLQSFNFEGSLAEMLRFWSSKLHFWRTSRTKACFWGSKLRFWRTSRTKASFLSCTASFLEEVLQKSFVFELQSVDFEGSLSGSQSDNQFFSQLKFASLDNQIISNLKISRHPNHSTRKAIDKQSNEAQVAGQSKSLETQSKNSQNHLSRTSVDQPAAWISDQSTTKSFDFQINWQRNQITWISDPSTTKSFESQINWQPSHFNFRSVDNQIIWISNRLTTNSLESQINWLPRHLNLKPMTARINWVTRQLTTKSLESQINSQPSRLNFRLVDNQIIWISNRLTSQMAWQTNRFNLTTIDNQLTWIWRSDGQANLKSNGNQNQLTTKPLDLQLVSIWHQLIFAPTPRTLFL